MIDPIAKDSIDLISVVENAGVELKRSGSRYVGLCPFHADEIPSFFVFPGNHFKCFGCGEHGDAIDFTQKYHGVDFKEALQILGIEQSKLTPQKRQEVKQLQYRRELAKTFKRWEIETADELAMLCRCSRKILRNIKVEEDLAKYGSLYHGLSLWEYHLDILIDDNNQAKLELFRTGTYG